jgi:hypothetical protein
MKPGNDLGRAGLLLSAAVCELETYSPSSVYSKIPSTILQFSRASCRRACRRDLQVPSSRNGSGSSTGPSTNQVPSSISVR